MTNVILTFSYLLFWFGLRNILRLAETHLETSLLSGRDLWKNSCQPSQPEIRSLDHLIEGLVKKTLV